MTKKEIIYTRRLQAKILQGVVQVVKVTLTSHGYDGYLGLCVGHPSLMESTIASSKLTEEISFMQYMMRQAKQGCTMTAQELMDSWKEASPTPAEVSITTDASTASTLTTLTPPVS